MDPQIRATDLSDHLSDHLSRNFIFPKRMFYQDGQVLR